MSDDVLAGANRDRPADVRVYVNERGVSVAHGATALDAVQACSPKQAALIAAGNARLTDSRGLPIDAGRVVSGGLILRIVPVRERAATDHVADHVDGAA